MILLPDLCFPGAGLREVIQRIQGISAIGLGLPRIGCAAADVRLSLGSCAAGESRYRPAIPAGLPVAAKRSASSAPAQGAAPVQEGGDLNADQALALVSMTLMQKLAAQGDLPWVWSEAEDGGSCDVSALRHRLELTQLALQTGAPLSTAEVTYLMGARPGGAEVERGGLRARRISRNVWKLAQTASAQERRGEVTSFASFNDGRRRFG